MKRLGTAGPAIGLVVVLGASGCASGDGGPATSTSGKPRPTATASQPSGLRTDLQPPPPGQAVRAVIAATRTLTSVHVTGHANFGGAHFWLDLSMTQDGSCTGTISLDRSDDIEGTMAARGGRSYLRGDEAFYQGLFGTEEGTRVAALLKGRWLRFPTAAVPRLADLCSLDHYRGFFDLTDVKHSVAVIREAPAEIDGTPVREFVLEQRTRNLRAWVAEGDGPPYIVQIGMPGSASDASPELGMVTFSDFDVPVTVDIPPASQTLTP